MRISGILLCVFVFLSANALAGEPGTKAGVVTLSAPKVAAPTLINHEIWGQTTYGDGYVYGPDTRASGMAAVDLDGDGDTDFIFPNRLGNPEWMVNFGSAAGFYPGGSRELKVTGLPDGVTYDLGLKFGDLNGDNLPDMVAVLVYRTPSFVKKVGWFKNMGPRSNPTFAFQGIVYTSPQTGTGSGFWLALADIDHDEDLDLFVAEAFLDTADRPHRLFKCENTGSTTVPQFAAPQEVTEISNQLPPRLSFQKVEASRLAKHEEQASRQMPEGRAKAVTYSYNMGDIAFYDWDFDGNLDFLFYNRDEGLFWIPNVGTPEAAVWDNKLGDNGTPIYSHDKEDGTDLEEATFALHANPDYAKPGAEWLDEIYLTVNNRLKIKRYLDSENDYVLVSQSAVTYPFSRGPAAFWDYDGDGDLDMFKASAESPMGRLKLIRNRGTVYSPAWDDTFLPIDDIKFSPGTADNHYREDQFVMAPTLPYGTSNLYVQRQDGTVDLYFGSPPAAGESLPTFESFINAYPEIVDPTHQEIAPAGIAVADFDGDGYYELVTVYQHSEGGLIYGQLVVVDQYEEAGEVYYKTYVLPDFLTDSDGNPLNPNLIESMAAGDIDGDGRPDLVVSTSHDSDYHTCELNVYRNVAFNFDQDNEIYDFRNVGRLDTVFNVDPYYARMPSLVDLDGDSDPDLFVSHRYPDDSGLNLRSYLRFYRNNLPTAFHYTRFRTTAGAQKTLSISATGGTVTPLYDVIQNSSGGTLLPNSVWQAGSFAPSVDILDTYNLRSDYHAPLELRAFVDVLPAVGPNESKAIIVVGDTPDDDLYSTFTALAAFGYYVLQGEGLSKQNIRLYAATNFDVDGDGVNDVTAAPTPAAIQDAVTNWGATPQKLLVYMVDHGQRGRFRLNATDFLEATTYDSWLDQIQSGGSGPRVTTVIDTCESGSFIKAIKGARRINISGANVGPTSGVAMFDKTQYTSFSYAFWLWLYNGNTYGSSFHFAKNTIESLNPLQLPQIDDNGNGTANEADDGLFADTELPGADFEVHGPAVFIQDVAPNQAVSSNTAMLWLSGVIAPFPVDSARAVIVPPNFQRPTRNNDDEQPVTNLPGINLSYNTTLSRWEGSFSGFTEGGTYQVQYAVTAGGQVYVAPHIGFVDRVGAPDAWESDDTPQTAQWLAINTVGGHNFHKAGDEDWVRFSVPAGDATVAIINARSNCQAVAELYRVADLIADPNATPLEAYTAEERGQELTFDHTFASRGQYLLRVRNFEPGLFGEGTSYQVIVAVDTGGILATTVVVSVFDENNAALPDAAISLSGDAIGATDATGIAQAVVSEYGNYTVTASKSGFNSDSQLVVVNNLIEHAVLHLKTGTTSPGGKSGSSMACAPDTAPHDLTGDALVVMAMAGLLATSRFRRRTLV